MTLDGAGRLQRPFLRPSHQGGACAWEGFHLPIRASRPLSPSCPDLCLALLCSLLQAFAAEFLSCCHLEGLIVGNATASEATQLCQDITAIINTTAAAAATTPSAAAATAPAERPAGGLVLGASARPAEVCVQLPAGVEVLHAAPARNPEERNCAVEVYYQVGCVQD